LTLLWFFGIHAAFAQDVVCTPLHERIEAAWSAFDDVELEDARAEVDQALSERTCQQSFVSTDDLVRLYELDALLHLSQGDNDAAAYAMVRSVTAAPDRPADPAAGPELAALHNTWVGRLSDATVDVGVIGDSPLYIDGVEVEPATHYSVVNGQHLVQWMEADVLYSEVREIVEPTVIATSPDADPTTLPSLEPPVVPGLATGDLTVTATDDSLNLPPPAPAPKKKTVGIPAVWGTGLAIAALGGGGLTTAFLLERKFNEDPYDDPTYGDCSVGDACYEDARSDAIVNDARLIRSLYIASYAALGVGGAMTITGFAIQPKRDGAAVQVSFHLP